MKPLGQLNKQTKVSVLVFFTVFCDLWEEPLPQVLNDADPKPMNKDINWPPAAPGLTPNFFSPKVTSRHVTSCSKPWISCCFSSFIPGLCSVFLNLSSPQGLSVDRVCPGGGAQFKVNSTMSCYNTGGVSLVWSKCIKGVKRVPPAQSVIILFETDRKCHHQHHESVAPGSLPAGWVDSLQFGTNSGRMWNTAPTCVPEEYCQGEVHVSPSCLMSSCPLVSLVLMSSCSRLSCSSFMAGLTSSLFSLKECMTKSCPPWRAPGSTTLLGRWTVWRHWRWVRWTRCESCD